MGIGHVISPEIERARELLSKNSSHKPLIKLARTLVGASQSSGGSHQQSAPQKPQHTPHAALTENKYNHHQEREDDMEHEYENARRPRKKSMELVIAHFNPAELRDMDEIQGKRTHIPGSPIAHYKGIERMIEKHPEIEHEIMRSFERHASGGSVGEIARNAEKMKQRGRFGDSEMAFIGPNTKRIFDRIVNDMGGNRRENKNPHTGHPEYFGLSNFFGGIKHGFDKFGKAAQSGLNKVGNVAQNGFNKAGLALGNVANNAVTHLKQSALPAVGGALQGFATGGPEGAMMGGAMGGMQGLQQSLNNPNNTDALSRFAQSGLGQNLQAAAGGAYDRYNQGQNWQNNAMQTAQQATQGLNDPYSQAFNQGANAYQASGGNPYQAAAGAVQGYTQGSQNPYMRGANAAASHYQQHANPAQAMAQGIRSMHHPMPYGNTLPTQG